MRKRKRKRKNILYVGLGLEILGLFEIFNVYDIYK